MSISDRLKNIICNGQHEFEGYQGESESRFAAIKGLVKAGISDEQILGLLLDDALAIHRRSKGVVTESYARAEIARAHAKIPTVADDFDEPIDPKWLQGATAKRPDKRKEIEFLAFDLPDFREIATRPWIYKPIYLRRHVTLTTAQGGVGKSSLSLVECVAMASGRNLLGIDVPDPLFVVYWNGEDDQEELTRRVAGICKHYDVSNDDLGGRLALHSGRDLPIVVASATQGGFQIAKPVVRELGRALQAFRADVFMIDPFVKSHEVSENDATAMAAVAYEWAPVASDADCAVGLIHHNRKLQSGTAGTIEDARGSSALINAARVRRALNPMTDSQAAAAGLESAARYGYFSADTSRSNLQPPATRLHWYKMESVSLENGASDSDPDHVGAPVVFDYADASQATVTETDEEAILATLACKDRWRSDPRSDEWIGPKIAEAVGIGVLVGDDRLAKANRKRVTNIVDNLITKGALLEVEELDDKRNRRKFLKPNLEYKPPAAVEGDGE